MTTQHPAPDLYRLEKSLLGDRLVPVIHDDEATHAGIAYLRTLLHERDRTIMALHGQISQSQHRISELERHGALHAQAQQAAAEAAQQQGEAARYKTSIRRLIAKNAALVGEKRRLRDALIGKASLPVIHYRVEVDRDGTARHSIVETLDAFPHEERVREALVEGRRRADTHGGQLRQLRLDTVAWRAVIQQVIDDT